MAVKRPGTAVEAIYQELRERIIEGEYSAGMRLSQDALASEFKVSRTPLREALQRLEADRLVSSEANRGMAVALTSIEQVEDCYAVRLLLEPPTLAAIVEDLTESEVADMRDALRAMERNVHRIRDYQQAHREFHELALRHYPESVQELTRSMALQIFRHQRLYFSRPQVPADFNDVDRLFLDALASHDTARARQLLEFHLLDAAFGMILDLEPDHSFSALLVVAKGLGIELPSAAPDRTITRPMRIRWMLPTGANLPALSTANLEYNPEAARA